MTIPGAERAIELGIQSVTVFATQQTVNSRTYRERMDMLDDTVEIEEIALPGDLVLKIENLLPVKRCHSLEDFKKILELYTEHIWNCVLPEWGELTKEYFSDYQPKECIIL